MNLHRDPEAFAELVTAASSELHIPVGTEFQNQGHGL